jgi:hypothetical protein
VISGALACLLCAGVVPFDHPPHPGTASHPAAAGAASVLADFPHDDPPGSVVLPSPFVPAIITRTESLPR